MPDPQALLNNTINNRPRSTSFLARLLEEVEKESQEERVKLRLRPPVPSVPVQQQTARPKRLYTYD